MIYDIDEARIQRQLTYLERCRHVLSTGENQMADDEKLFLFSRAIHIAVECIIDVGTVIIDGFIMRDPGGYQDIVDILEDEKVITRELAKGISNWVVMRDRLIRQYTEVELAECYPFIKEHRLLSDFQISVRNYLRQELQTERVSNENV